VSLAGRVILGTAAVTSAAMLVAAALVHLVLRAYLSPFAAHFASMQHNLGWGPDLASIYGLVDETLALSFGIALLLGVLIGVLVGRELSRSVAVIDHGLAQFAAGSPTVPFRPSGRPNSCGSLAARTTWPKSSSARSAPNANWSPESRTTSRIRSRRCAARSKRCVTA
jgi:hypothetical protein